MGETLSRSSLCLGTRLQGAAKQLLKLKTSVQAQRGRSGGGNGGGAPRRTCPGPARCLCGTPTRCCGSPQTRRRAWRPTRAAPGATRWGWTRTCPGRLLAAWWGAAAPGTPSWRPAGAPGDCAVLRRSLERLGGCLLAFSSGGDQWIGTVSDRSLESPHFCLLRVLPLRRVLVCSAWRPLQHLALIQACSITLSPPARACSARATAPPPWSACTRAWASSQQPAVAIEHNQIGRLATAALGAPPAAAAAAACGRKAAAAQ